MREAAIEAHLVDQVREIGGEVRKVKWIGRHGAPDRCVMYDGRTVWVELKRPGEKAKPHQLREHERMRRMGQTVSTVDTLEGVDKLIINLVAGGAI